MVEVKEEWCEVPGYERVIVSDQGRVATILKGSQNELGYVRHRLWDGRCGKWFQTGRLVLSAFSGISPQDLHCAHLNGKPNDNRLVNLAWKTRKENEADKVRHGTKLRGETVPWAKLTEDDVRTIRNRRSVGESLAAIGRDFGVTKENIHMIVTRQTWSHVA